MIAARARASRIDFAWFRQTGEGRRKVAARIRQAEELTTLAAPGNGPGSTANGKSLGARIIARVPAAAKVDKSKFEMNFFIFKNQQSISLMFC